MKKILFAIAAALIMILAVTAVPTVNSNESDVDEYVVNTVEVKDQFQSYLDSLNNKAEEQMVYDEEDCSCSLNTTAYEMYGEQEYDDVPIALTFNENGITSDYSPEVPEDIASTNDNTTYDLVFDENGNIYDVIITVDGQNYSARDLYDPVEDCFVDVLCAGAYVAYVPVYTSIAVSTGWIPFIGWIIAIIMIVIIVAVVCYYYYTEHHAETEDGTIHFDYTTKIVDGIEFGYDNNNPIPKCLSIYGTDYAFSSKYIDNTSNKDNDNYYFAYLDDHKVYIFPSVITKTTACAIINLNNADFNVFTYYGANASAIVGPYPVYHSAHHEGEYNHYHKGFYIGGKMDNESSHSLFMY